MPRFTSEELEIIRQGYADPLIKVRDIAEKLNRPSCLISMKAKKLGLRKKPNPNISKCYCSSCAVELVKDVNWYDSSYRRKRFRCKDCTMKHHREIYYQLKQQVFNRLGNKCVKCGYSGYALQVDHINGGGTKELKDLFNNTRIRYFEYLLSLSEKELVSKYQSLCANCNIEKYYTNLSLPHILIKSKNKVK